MPEVDIGPIITGGDIEQAMAATLKAWVPFYLARIDEALDLVAGTTQPPLVYGVSSAMHRWAEQVPPALIVVSPGLVGTPEMHGDSGGYTATWQVNIGVTVGGATEDGSRALAHRHAAAVRYVLAQQGSLDGLALATWWVGEQYDVVEARRSLMAAEVLAHVQVGRTVDTRGDLPGIPPVDPLPPYPPTPTASGRRIRTTRNP